MAAFIGDRQVWWVMKNLKYRICLLFGSSLEQQYFWNWHRTLKDGGWKEWFSSIERRLMPESGDVSADVVVHGGYWVINPFVALSRQVATFQVWHWPHPTPSSRAVHVHVPRVLVFGEAKLAVVSQSRQQRHLVWWRPSSATKGQKKRRRNMVTEVPPIILPWLSLEERSKV